MESSSPLLFGPLWKMPILHRLYKKLYIYRHSVSLCGACMFSSLDLCSGYWQVEMDEASIEKTSFTTLFGLNHFLSLSFGLKNSGATFHLGCLTFSLKKWHLFVCLARELQFTQRTSRSFKCFLDMPAGIKRSLRILLIWGLFPQPHEVSWVEMG